MSKKKFDLNAYKQTLDISIGVCGYDRPLPRNQRGLIYLVTNTRNNKQYIGYKIMYKEDYNG